jgi:hypothetical protein
MHNQYKSKKKNKRLDRLRVAYGSKKQDHQRNILDMPKRNKKSKIRQNPEKTLSALKDKKREKFEAFFPELFELEQL